MPPLKKDHPGHDNECRKVIVKRKGVVQAYCTNPQGHTGNHAAYHPAI